MNALSIGPLSTLAPRAAGAEVIEPRIEFDEVTQGLHPANRCPYTCGCRNGTAICVTTGNSDFS